MNDAATPETTNSFLTMLMNNWQILLIILLAIILIFFVIIPLLIKLNNKRKKVSETKDLKKDLRVWDNLAALVRGGEEGREARKKLSAELKLITAMFQQGISIIRKAGRKPYDMPWYILIGEPQSGKSTLLENCDAGFACSVAEDAGVMGKKISLPLRCWLGAKAFILDVSGKVFFDRWLEDSSAEWTHLLKLLTGKHSRLPLNGILLVLPVDALLTDSQQLARQKLDLILAEIQQLLLRTGEKLPCQVIVTKMDMLSGFREYFNNSDQRVRESVFGWENSLASGKFSSKEFRAYFLKARETLRGAVASKMAESSLFRLPPGESRMQATGNMYQFPESFFGLQQKLDFYLNGLFGDAYWHGFEQLSLGGVFFTSSKDQGITFSPKFASLCGKSLDQAAITTPEVSRPAMFSKGLLLNQIHEVPSASLLPGTRLKCEWFGILCCVLICAIAFIWSYCQTLDADSAFNQHLAQATEYYNGLAKHISAEHLDNSPLVEYDLKKQKAEMTPDKPMSGWEGQSRLQFFYGVRTRAQEEIHPPFGHHLVSWILFGEGFNQGADSRNLIFNEILTRMVYIPSVKATQAHFLQKQNDPFDLRKRDAALAFEQVDLQTITQKYIPASIFLEYLFPTATHETLDILSVFKIDFLTDQHPGIANIVFGVDYQKAQEKVTEDFRNSWMNLTIYPETLYPQLREILLKAQKIKQQQEEINRIASLKKKTQADLDSMKKLFGEQSKAVEELNERVVNVKTLLVQANFFLTKNDMQSNSPIVDFSLFSAKQLLAFAEKDYQKKLDEDIDAVFKLITEVSGKVRCDRHRRDLDLFQQSSYDLNNHILPALKMEFQRLEAVADECSNNKLFKKLQTKKQEKVESTDTDQYVTDVLLLVNRALLSLEIPAKQQTVESFQDSWNALLRSNDAIRATLDELKKRVDDEAVLAYILLAEDYLACQLENSKIAMATQAMAFYPNNTASFISQITELKNVPDADSDLPKQLAEESVGTIAIQLGFKPNTMIRYLEPMQTLLSQKMPKNAKPLLEQIENGPLVQKAVSGYLDSYISYWSEVADSAKPQLKDWKDFRAYCARLKPYEVNMVLFQAYKLVIRNLQVIPDVLLTEAQKATRTALIAKLNNRIQILTPMFTEVCIRQVSAWSLLPDDPLAAYRTMNELPAKSLKANYFAVLNAGNKCDIPWWDNLFRTGTEMLKNAAGKEIMAPMNNKKSSWMRFPLCADSCYNSVIMEPELKDILKILNDIGFDTPQDAPAGGSKDAPAAKKETDEPAADAISFSNLGLAEKMDKSMYEWGEKLHIICDALLNPVKDLVCTIACPDEAKRQQLTSDRWLEFPQTAVRYRYWNVRSGGVDLMAKRSTSDLNPLSLVVGQDDLDLCFYLFAGDSQPAAVVHCSGPWAALHLYLLPNSVYDAQKKTLYAPVIVKDKMDQQSLFWLALTFNKTLPAPQTWPNMENWPQFSAVQTKLNEKRNVPETDWNALVLSSKNFDSLLNKLLEYDRGIYPKMNVSLPVNEVRQNPDFLKFRYMEMAVPGQTSKRIQLDAPKLDFGSVDLSATEIKFRLFRYAQDQKPALEITVSGPYAPLRLLTAQDRKQSRDAFSVLWTDKNLQLPLLLQLQSQKPKDKDKK